MGIDFDKYLKMGDINPNTELRTKQDKIDPEDELFHRIFISGKTRRNEKIGKKLIAGFLQINGVDYNLEEIYMIPFYKRNVLTKKEKIGRYENPVCFSYFDYDENGKQISSCGFPCPQNSDERKMNEWCASCRMSIILIGMLCDANGAVKKDSEGKPYNIFVVFSGSKYMDGGSYIYDCQELEVPYLFPDTDNEQLIKQEMEYFNILRRIIKISVEEVPVYDREGNKTDYVRNAYILEGQNELPREQIFKLLDYAESLDNDIREKFDITEWAKKNSKKVKNKLLAFQNSQIFKQECPDFVPDSDIPSHMLFDSVGTKNKDTEKTKTSNNANDPNDIPF